MTLNLRELRRWNLELIVIVSSKRSEIKHKMKNISEKGGRTKLKRKDEGVEGIATKGKWGQGG